MALRDYSPQTVTVNLPGSNSFAVAGLSLSDLTSLLSEHRADFLAAVALFEEHKADPANFALDAIKILPELVAKAVARAAGEPDAVRVVASLPAPILLEAVMAIGRLTFEDEGALPKFIANLTSLAGGVGAAIKKTH